MRCDGLEDRILKYHGNMLSARGRKELEDHLAACADCRRLAQRLEELDATLSRRLNAAALSPGFADRVRQRIRTEAASAAPSAPDVAERKRRLHLEYQAGEARLREGIVRFAPLLPWLAYAALLAVVGWLLSRVAVDVGAAWLDAFRWLGPNPGAFLPLASVLFLLLMLGQALWPQLRRRWA
jgi:anti-sigma factor RsiW